MSIPNTKTKHIATNLDPRRNPADLRGQAGQVLIDYTMIDRGQYTYLKLSEEETETRIEFD